MHYSLFRGNQVYINSTTEDTRADNDVRFGWGRWSQHTAHVDAFPASTCLHTSICIFMCLSLFSSLRQKPEVTNTQFPTCVHLALISAILLSEAVASCHPTGAPTRGALKCPSPPTWRKQYCMCRQGPGGGMGVSSGWKVVLSLSSCLLC